MEDWVGIRRLRRAEGLGIKTIARRLGVAGNTVRAALRSDTPWRYERTRQGSIVDGVESEIRRLLKDVPDMPDMVIAERIGWERGMMVLRDPIAQLRPLFVSPDPAQCTWYRPGELARWDLWPPDVPIPVGFRQVRKLWTVVGVSGHSRLIGALMVPSRAAHNVLAGMLHVIGEFGAVPPKAVWDQEGCIGRIRQGKQVLTAEFQSFGGTLAWEPSWSGPMIRRRRAWWKEPTAIWKPVSCRDAPSKMSPISTGNSPAGCNEPTSGSTAPPVSARRRRSSRTGAR